MARVRKVGPSMNANMTLANVQALEAAVGALPREQRAEIARMLNFSGGTQVASIAKPIAQVILRGLTHDMASPWGAKAEHVCPIEALDAVYDDGTPKQAKLAIMRTLLASPDPEQASEIARQLARGQFKGVFTDGEVKNMLDNRK